MVFLDQLVDGCGLENVERLIKGEFLSLNQLRTSVQQPGWMSPSRLMVASSIW